MSVESADHLQATGHPPGQRGLPPGARGLRLASEPTFSVVLASTRPRGELEACLRTLVEDCRAIGVELVVVRCTTPAELASLATAHPYALFMPAPDGSSVRQLRTATSSPCWRTAEGSRPAGWPPRAPSR